MSGKRLFSLLALLAPLTVIVAVPQSCNAQAMVKHLKHSGYIGPFMDARDIDRSELHDARHLARLGNVDAQYNAGAMYHALGRYPNAIYWYRRAALFGHPLAAYNLGILYYEGRHVAHDLDRSVRWLQVAADSGYPQAQTQLGYLAYRGELEDAEPGTEFAYYRKAALRDDPLAQFNLGVLLWQGEGIERDPVEAYAWLARAAAEVDRESLVASVAENLSEAERMAAEARSAELEAEIEPFVMR